MGRPASTGQLHGVIVVDKPAGWTSHDVVARARRLFDERRIGHAGTLDPAATGVLPLAVGQGTRVLEYLTEASKAYLADITFGVTTDSYDADGRVTSVADPSELTEKDVRRGLDRFVGTQEQLPPMHSAIRVGGQRLYEAARRGETIERSPRIITINEISLVSWSPPTAVVQVECSKGTYIRTIADDLGRVLGTGAYLSNLVRTRVGGFFLCEAWTLDEIALLEDDILGCWPWLAHHPDRIVEDWPTILLNRGQTAFWRQGRTIRGTATDEQHVRAYDPHATWLGVGVGSAHGWRPSKVIGEAR